LDFADFDPDRDEVVARATAAGVTTLIVPATDLASCAIILTLIDRYPSVYGAVGVHPNSSADWADEWLEPLAKLANQPRVVAIGEIGLDYYRDQSPPETQRRAFRAQLALARRLGKPVIVHNRAADEDVLSILADHAALMPGNPGVLHSFSGTVDLAEAALALGYFLGFTGPITYKRAEALRQAASATPLERLLVETDAPFLPPQPWRGQRNEPGYVTAVAARVAELHGLPLVEVEAATTANARRLFGLPTW
jgi:TatD DNase family protein